MKTNKERWSVVIWEVGSLTGKVTFELRSENEQKVERESILDRENSMMKALGKEEALRLKALVAEAQDEGVC